ncbi:MULTISPECIES: AraC family transcriptional regulator [unclassified Paenibacillus]|uniref:AraC family transcriptional regulator n=1 Tax=unclassified Paenibacillus TaxID=185978 RepID=UPI0001AAF71A|nr:MULTISPECIES: AraC family transcriptional regulator [unclassified Paenibacillus]ACS99164.1 transcriptional regulator, AraC family [Paenibacillus sp. JDR-2]NIK69309.1 AraC-like DNA-binding protein [Paenibacillus sp. BK720]TCM92736.1 AraC-like DNA-binding protein [Paenibacillus sp. BK033]
MSEELLLTFRSPPLPFFIESNRRTYQAGEEHPNRTNLGVFDLLFVQQGSLYIAEEGNRWTLQAGDVLILRPDRWHHSFKPCQEETVFDWVHFQTVGAWEETEASQGSLRGDYYTYAIRLPKKMHLSFPDEAKLLFSQLHEAAQSSSHGAFWERQQRFLHLLQMLDEGWRSDAAKAGVSVAERAAAYLKMNYRSVITNTMLSEALQLHTNYITRCMTEVFGCTPQQYLLYYRLDQAKLLLIKTDWPIARVAEETGFRQTPHFSRLFAAQTGMPPLKFRKRFTN